MSTSIFQVLDQGTVVTEVPQVNVVVSEENQVVVVDKDHVQVVSVAVQGPPGPAAVGGGGPVDTTVYAKRVDLSLDQRVIYVGRAPIGAFEDQARWRIARISVNYQDQSSTEKYPNGSQEMNFTWNDRTTYTYE